MIITLAQQRLMRGCEWLLAFAEKLGVRLWPDWGTLLGYQRQSNVIPWDYDADYCVLKPEYDVLVTALSQTRLPSGMQFTPDYYHEAENCCMLGLDPDDIHGICIDIVAYRNEGTYVRSLMSPQLIAGYPGNYDFPRDVVFPLQRGFMFGQRGWFPKDATSRLRECYGEWQKYPEGQTTSKYTESPFWVIPDFSNRPARRVPFIQRNDSRVARSTDLTGYVRWSLNHAGPQTVWVVPSNVTITENKMFSDLVWEEEAALWGKVWVGYLGTADSLYVPAGHRAVKAFC